MPHRITFHRKAAKQLRDIPKNYLPKILASIGALSNDPRPSGVVKLSAKLDTYRVRQGPYRIIYQVRDSDEEITVLSILHRRDAYR